jgi:hypothetical protein
VTLLRALKRNKNQARAYPLQLSDLYRANARVAAHLGLDDAYSSSTWNIYRTLKAGMPNDKERQLYALMDVAEMIAETKGQQAARDFYDGIASRARKAGRPDLAALSQLFSLVRHSPPSTERDQQIEKIANSNDPALKDVSLDAKLALARIAFEDGDTAKGAAIARQIGTLPTGSPILIYEPQVAFAQHELEQSPFRTERYDPARESTPQGTPYEAFSTTRRLTGNLDDEWIDVSFRIAADGTVSGLKVVNKRGDDSWSKPLLAAIAERRYTPGRPGDPHSQRLERYTYTSGYEEATGTHRLEHSPQARIEFFDLSPDKSLASN